jgi:hypothetical protein
VLDFAEVKKIKLTDVAGRYAIKLRYRGEWASAPCPLPTHKAGDRGRNFTINLAQNYWRCFSESCNEKNGGKKGGDCINFVALMENCRERDAAQKLADWYGLNGEVQKASKVNPSSVDRLMGVPLNRNKKGEHMARPLKEDNQPQRAQSDRTSPAVEVKSGYMHDIGIKMEALLCVIADEMIRKQVKKEVMKAIYDSYKNGKAARI